MRSTPIGLVMVDDERPHAHERTREANLRVLHRWAQALAADAADVDGEAPEIVTPPGTITSVADAHAAGEQLRRAGCRSLILCFNVWNFPYLVWPLVNMVGRDVPILSLSSNNGALPGNVGLLATDGALRQAGLRTHRIVGNVDEPGTRARVRAWLRAAQAATLIGTDVFGLYGGHSMGMETGYLHLVPVSKALGTSAYQIDQLWITERMGSIDQREVSDGRHWLEGLLGERLRYDGAALTPEKLETQLRLYLAVDALNEENGFAYCGIKGQRELTENVCTADVAEMLLNDPYDWRGAKAPTVCATEADAGGAVTMQLLKYISGGLPSLFMDVRLYHPELDLWDLCNSGQHASWYATRTADPSANFAHITFHPALSLYFPAGGASVEFDAAPGPLTFARLGLWDDRPYLVIVRGEVLSLPAEKRRQLNRQTDPTWPHVHARLDCDYDEFIRIFPCNHVHATPGDQVESLVTLAEMRGIAPVVLGGPDAQRPVWSRVAG
jgi:L-fucose isomerase